MIELIVSPTPRVVAFRVTGKIDHADFDAILPVMEQAAADHETISLYVELDEWRGMTAKALLEDLKIGVSMTRSIQREAIVTNQKLLKTWTGIAGKLWPGVEARAFSPVDKEAAMTWAAAKL